MKAFISYSHRDTAALERLHTHLAMLKREQLITAWYDRDILAGGTVDKEINAELASCELFLALASPDFLNSKYCYEREMRMAIDRHAEGNLRIVPIILEPCEWNQSPLGQFKALPKDGRPVSEWTNQNAAFLDVVTELRRVISKPTQPEMREHNSPVQQLASVAKPRYRIKKTFDEIDRSDFARESFEKIRDYFRRSISEIDQIEGLRARYVDLGPLSFTCTVLNQMKKHGSAHITFHLLAGTRMGFGEISYSFAENAPANTSNGWINIGADDFDQYLILNSFGSHGKEDRISVQQAALHLWEEFVGNAGITS